MATSEDKKAANRAYYAENAEACKATQARYRNKHRKKIHASQKRYRDSILLLYLAKARLRGRQNSGMIDATAETKHGLCPICQRIRKLYCDHDHATGLKRGWLCCFCNLRLGWYEKYTDRIVGYLKGLL